MRRLLALVLTAAAVALGLLPAAPAQASCVQRDARSFLERVDAAFVGTYVERRGPHWVFAVEQVVKGTLGPEVLVLAPAGPGTSVDLLVRRLSAARAGRTVRLGVRIAGARDAVHVVQVGWGDGTSSSVTLRAGDDGAVLGRRFGPARRRTVTARVETVPFGGCGPKVLRSAPARVAFRVSRG